MPKGRKKTQEQKDAEKRVKLCEFIGGPKDGEKITIVNPPPEKIRMAIPEWCTYEWDSRAKVYRYIGDIRLEGKITI